MAHRTPRRAWSLRRKIALGILAAVILLAIVVAVRIAPRLKAMPDPNAPLTVAALGGGAYWVKGGVSNTGFVVGRDGVIVIDPQMFDGTARNQIAAIARVTAKPIRHIIVTHSDPDHVNGLASYPAGIDIIAHPQATAEMLEALDYWVPGFSSPPKALRDHLPGRLVAGRAALMLSGVEVQLIHAGPAHTDGDLIAYFPAQRIVYAGDILTPEVGPYPGLHLEKHGSSLGWIAFMRAMLALDADRFVSGHGGVLSRAEVEQRLAVGIAQRARIAALVRQGKTLDQIREELHDRRPEGIAGLFPTFVETTYRELTGR